MTMMTYQSTMGRQWLLSASFLSILSAATSFTLLAKNHQHPRPHDAVVSTQLYQQQQSSSESEMDDEPLLLALLDESVLLYSQVPRSSLSSSQEVNQELQSLRKAEITTLIEDLALVRITAWPLSLPSDNDKPPSKSSLSELSQQLDQALMEGYQTTFAPEEFDEWTKHIERLYIAVESELNFESSIRLLSPATAEPETGSVETQQLQTRLTQLKTLIDGPGTSTVMPRIMSTQQQEQLSPSLESSEPKIIATEPSIVVETFANANIIEENKEGPDLVTAVVSAAALSAVAYTGAPLFAAGIALGPLVKSSIAYAEAVMLKSQNRANRKKM